MKIVVIRSNLREALGLVDHATGEIPNLPILHDVLIEARDGHITLTATNLEIGVVATVPGKVIEDGSVVIPLLVISNLMGNLQSDRLNIEAKGHHIEIKTDNYTATLQGAAPTDFPQIPAVDQKKGATQFKIKGIILREAIQQVAAASQMSELRPELNSILFDFSVDTLKLTATDGFRLAEKTISKNTIDAADKIEPFRILVPIKTAYEVARGFNNDEMVLICHDDNQVLFKTEQLQIISRLINGQFPEYSQLIPKSFSTEIIINRDEFMNAIKVVSVLGQKNNEIALTLKQDKKTIIIHSKDQTMGENEYLLPIKAKGEGLDVIFNWRQLTDAVKVMNSEEIFMGFQEEMNPSIIKSQNDTSYFYILKPLMKG